MPKKLNIKIMAVAVLVTVVSCLPIGPAASAAGCPDLKIVFARGSGGVRWEDTNYIEFRDMIKSKLDRFELNYEFEDLDYPAIGMNIDNIWSVLGAYFGGGDSYEFGASVDKGVSGLVDMINNKCPGTRYVIGGYSQGAMVVSKALHSINADRVIYAATFGDPKIYLPEGEGLVPVACSGENLSDYRIYVPDCRAYEGLLGSYRPYEPYAYSGKLGTWCNKFDVFCSSHFSLSSHTSYVSDSLYEDASKVIVAKVLDAFNIDQHVYSAHDTAFLIDSTGSMEKLIDKYKSEAMNLARQTLENGGRVALYDYRDLKDPYHPVKHCDFETCDIAAFRAGLDEIRTGGGGDSQESLLSASISVMNELTWKVGATKSLVVLTDGGYHDPDIDGTEFIDVVKLSKEIDPVNIYVVTTTDLMTVHSYLPEATGGMVVNSTSDLGVLTDTIMERYDSLPRVEETDSAEPAPVVEITEVADVSDTEVKVKFETDALKVMLVVNDAVLGLVEGNEVSVGDLDRSVVNTISLVPLSDSRRGVSKSVKIEASSGYGEDDKPINESLPNSALDTSTSETMLIPKTPNTGRGM